MGGDKIHVDSQHLVETASSDVTSITVSQGENEGGGANAFTGGTKSLFSVQHGPGYVGPEVTEHASPTTFHYVSQCSNRGTCDSSTGICKCLRDTATTTVTHRTCLPCNRSCNYILLFAFCLVYR